MREIPLTRGYVTIVDDEDYEKLLKLKWCALVNSGGKYVYAVSYFRLRPKIYNPPLFMQKIILGIPVGDPTKVKHRDRNTLNNRKGNLIVVKDVREERLSIYNSFVRRE